MCVCVGGGSAVVSLVECSGIGRAFWDGIGETEQLLKVMNEQFTVCMCVWGGGEGVCTVIDSIFRTHIQQISQTYEPFDLVLLVHNLLHLQGSELGCQPVTNVHKG